MKVKFVKNENFDEKPFLCVRKKHAKIQGNIFTNNIDIAYLDFLTKVNTYRWCVSFGVKYMILSMSLIMNSLFFAGIGILFKIFLWIPITM